MTKQHNDNELKIILSIIMLATLTRIAIPSFISHIPNFSPIDAIALCCGAFFNKRLPAIATVLVSVWVGDVFLNKIFTGSWVLFYPGFYWQYASYVLITGMGIFFLKTKNNSYRLIATCLASSFLFFVISNFGVWLSSHLYPLTINGLTECYIAAIPFLKNTIFSDLFFTLILFSAFKIYSPRLSSGQVKSEAS